MLISFRPEKGQAPKDFDEKLNEQLADIPKVSAIYFVRSTSGVVLYVGVAADLGAIWAHQDGYLLPQLYTYSSINLEWSELPISELRLLRNLYFMTKELPVLNRKYQHIDTEYSVEENEELIVKCHSIAFVKNDVTRMTARRTITNKYTGEVKKENTHIRCLPMSLSLGVTKENFLDVWPIEEELADRFFTWLDEILASDLDWREDE